MIAFNRENQVGCDGPGVADSAWPGDTLQPEARYVLDGYLLKLCHHLHQALLEIRDHLVSETETQVLQRLEEGSPEQVQAALDRLGEPQGYAALLIKDFNSSNS